MKETNMQPYRQAFIDQSDGMEALFFPRSGKSCFHDRVQ